MPHGVPCAPGQIPCIPVRVRLPITNCCEVAVRGHNSLSQTPWVNTHSYNIGTPLTGTIAAAIASAVATHVVPAMQVIMSNQSVFDNIRVSDYLVPTGVATVTNLPGGTIGTRSNPPLPTNASAVMSYHSGLAGRSHNGRQYNTGLTDADVTEDALNPSYLLDANLVGIAWNTIAPALVTAHPVVASITKGLFTQIISHVMDAFVDSRRKRLIKG